MASIASNLSTTQANLAAAQASLANIVAGVAALDTLIQSFESGSTSELNPTDQAALNSIVAQSAALAAQAASINTAAPAPPASPSGVKPSGS